MILLKDELANHVYFTFISMLIMQIMIVSVATRWMSTQTERSVEVLQKENNLVYNSST